MSRQALFFWQFLRQDSRRFKFKMIEAVDKPTHWKIKFEFKVLNLKCCFEFKFKFKKWIQKCITVIAQHAKLSIFKIQLILILILKTATCFIFVDKLKDIHILVLWIHLHFPYCKNEFICFEFKFKAQKCCEIASICTFEFKLHRHFWVIMIC